MTAARGIFAGIDRHLGAWRRSALKLRGVKPTFDVAALPMTWALAGFPTDFDQEQLGSCGPNSLGEVYAFDLKAAFSRLFAYYWTRSVEGDIADDGGVTIPDLLTVGHTMGLPLEQLWPYNIGAFTQTPPSTVVAEAIKHRVTQWDVIVDIDHLLFEVSNGQPVTLGFNVPASMQSDACARTGMVNVPSETDAVIGGHCVNAIGFDRARELVKCTCHYGPTFGDGGCIWLPFAMFTSGNAMDLSAVRTIS